MVQSVLRYRCDLCGSLHLLEGLAAVCEAMCAEAEAKAIEARRAETLGSVEDESAVPKGFAQRIQGHDPS